jgi:Zn ribbon nucleic-acid-binding protein
MSEPLKCPRCGEECVLGEYVENGVGMQKCSPDYCMACGWSEEDLLRGLNDGNERQPA